MGFGDFFFDENVEKMKTNVLPQPQVLVFFFPFISFLTFILSIFTLCFGLP